MAAARSPPAVNRSKKELEMATNPPSGDGRRIGAIRQREQFRLPNGNYMKRDTRTGRFLDQKSDGKPFKGVRKVK